jgi:5-hydroxyisourate hydrolase
VHRLSFATAEYAAAIGTPTFWPLVTILFEVTDPTEHHHVPLLFSPFGYSTYRGS